MKGFMEFIREQGIVGFATGFILGGAISKLVSSLVNNIINPILGIILGATGDLSSAYIQIGSAKIMWGLFVNNVIDFLVIAVIVYYSVRVIGLTKLDIKKDAAPKPNNPTVKM